MGCSLIYSHNLVPKLDFWTLAKMRMFQTAGLAFMFVPISTVAFSTLPRTSNADASALFTMFRNYFGSLSISAATALVQDRSQVRQAYLTDHTSPLDPGYVLTMRQVEQSLLAQGRAAANTASSATNWLYQQLHAQAAVLAYSDVFMTTAIISFCIVPFCFLMSAKTGSGGGRAGALGPPADLTLAEPGLARASRGSAAIRPPRPRRPAADPAGSRTAPCADGCPCSWE